MVTNDLFLIINETTFSGQTFSFTLIANNMYGNTSLYNNFISRFYIFNSLLLLLFSLYIAVPGFQSNGTADNNGTVYNNCDDITTAISISVCVFILVMLSIYFCICFCYLCIRILFLKDKKL